MKKLLFLLSCLALACSKPDPILYETGFNAAYVTGACMDSKPEKVVLTFDGFVKELPVKEVRTGITSTDTFMLEEGQYTILDVSVYDSEGNKVASMAKEFDDQGWVVSKVPYNHRASAGAPWVSSQLFCPQFFNNK